MNQFSGHIEAQSLIDIVQFYAQSNATVRINIKTNSINGNLWLSNNRLMHASSNDNFGIDAFYELMTLTEGHFEIFFSESADVNSINRPWTDLVLEYYVLVDEGKVPDPALQLFNKPEATKLLEKNKQSRGSIFESNPFDLKSTIRGTNPDIKPIVDLNEADFSDLNAGWDITTPPKSHNKSAPPSKKTPSQPIMRSYKAKLQALFELDGVLAVSLVDSATGMSIVEESKSKEIDLSKYSAYMVEVLKAHKKFLKNLNIKETIEDIIINLDKKYHVISYINEADIIFIYVILDKEYGNLAITRMVIQEVEEDLAKN